MAKYKYCPSRELVAIIETYSDEDYMPAEITVFHVDIALDEDIDSSLTVVGHVTFEEKGLYNGWLGHFGRHWIESPTFDFAVHQVENSMIKVYERMQRRLQEEGVLREF